MEVTLIHAPDLPAGTLLLPGKVADQGPGTIRLGALTVPAEQRGGAPAGELHLAGDLWQRLAIPFGGVRLHLRRTAADQWELGPVVTVLYPGTARSLTPRRARGRASLVYGDKWGSPGLYCLGFDEGIDWEAGHLTGFVVDNRPGSVGEPVPATFPLPAAVRLSFSIMPAVVEQLRERTGNRTFNWVRGMDKFEFYRLMADVPGVREHLPETRLVQGPADLAVMLTHHDTIFIKNVFGSRGKEVARVCRLEGGLAVEHLHRGQRIHQEVADADALMEYLRPVMGRGRWIVQQGVRTAGWSGRPAHFRIVLVKGGRGQWICPTTEALVAPDRGLAFTNLANGAAMNVLTEYLVADHGLSPAKARRCEDEIIEICLRMARRMESPLHPLGILGCDVGRDVETGQLWVFEANTVPGWGYPEEVEQAMARTMIDYAVSLADWDEVLAH